MTESFVKPFMDGQAKICQILSSGVSSLNCAKKFCQPVWKIILAIAAIRGLWYVALVPPWQHYDEPSHFEYAWLIANRQRLPQQGEYDSDMRREVLASMHEHLFFYGTDLTASLLDQDPVWIGFSAFRHPPLYYILAAVPLWLLRDTDVVGQLYAARLVSWLLYLFTVWIAWRLTAELFSCSSPLCWLVPLVTAWLSAFTDLMTAVNNDVGATALVSLFLWGAVRMIRRGITWGHLVWVLGTTILCAWTKNTAWVAFLLTPVVLVWGWFRGQWRWWTWCGVAVTGVAMFVAAFEWGDVACWYRSTAQRSSTGQRVAAAPWGKRAIAIEVSADDPGASMIQYLPPVQAKALRGKTVTFGAWIWASSPTRVYTPLLYDGKSYGQTVIETTTTPTFYAITATLSSQIRDMWLQLGPRPQQEAVTVYYDGIFLLEGEWDIAIPPQFQDDGATGTWSGSPFANLVRNSSAESLVPRVRPWLEALIARYGWSFSHILVSLLDWQGTARTYSVIFQRLAWSFWGRFAWNSLGLPDGWYTFLIPLGLLGVLGGGLFILQGIRQDRASIATKRTVFLFGLTLLFVWGLVFLRGLPVMGNSYLPVARYAYPAIIPTVLLLVGGWWNLCPARLRRWFPLALVGLLVWLDIASLWTIASFFYGR